MENLNKGFTLIELMVVISIIGLLSSVILASTNTVKAKGRDSSRIQAVHQMDLAIKLYAADHNGDVPKFTNCGSTVLNCTGTSGTIGSQNWTALTTALSPYIKTMPTSLNGVDYVYVGPTDIQDPTTYQISAAMETGSVPQTGYSSSGTFVTVASLQNQTLTVSLSGNGTGTVTSSPEGINCGTTCSTSIANGTSVTLTATPPYGSIFAGWSGACSGTGSCVITMNNTQSVSATFNPLWSADFNPTIQSFAVATCASLDDDTGPWHLPNSSELQRGMYNQFLNQYVFPNSFTLNYSYWTSFTYLTQGVKQADALWAIPDGAGGYTISYVHSPITTPRWFKCIH